MKAGTLNRRILIEQPGAARNHTGGLAAQAWVAVATVWAGVRHLSGVEKDATGKYGGIVSVARTEFTIRQRTDIDGTMRVSFKGSYYGIVHINDVLDAHDRMVITCESGAKDGA
ncbi:phage head closure protein [Paraburkholderia sp. DGU8]|uniref:phage head closure protein n=1 Tax=Paraburkholderia sp. DGU8 TaxID=3161997 RepID=UPI0034670E03